MQQRKYKADLGINTSGLCDQWHEGGQEEEELLLIPWHLVHSRKWEIALTTSLKHALKSS